MNNLFKLSFILLTLSISTAAFAQLRCSSNFCTYNGKVSNVTLHMKNGTVVVNLANRTGFAAEARKASFSFTHTAGIVPSNKYSLAVRDKILAMGMMAKTSDRSIRLRLEGSRGGYPIITVMTLK